MPSYASSLVPKMAPATKKKVVWVGDSKSGKTCLTGALYGETLVQRQYDPTVFDNKDVVFATQVGQEEVEVQVSLFLHARDSGSLRRSGRRRSDGQQVRSSPRITLFRPPPLKVTLSDTSGDEGYDRLRPLSYLDTDLVSRVRA